MNSTRRIAEAAGDILYRQKDDAELTWASPPSVKFNIATDGTIIVNITNSDDETTAASDASNAASIPDPTQIDSPATAGNVLSRIELCIVHRPKRDDWSWSRGKVNPNESHRHAVVCEIGGESSLPMELGPYLGDTEYPLSEESHKQRHTKNRSADTKHIQFWMATPVNAANNLRRAHAFSPVHRADTGEIDEALWLMPAEAREELSHSTDKDILALLVDRAQEGVLNTVSATIMRHGKAETHKLWKDSDANRPITPRGAAAACALSRELARFSPTRLVASPRVRCQETSEMFTWRTGRDMVHLDPLTEDAYAAAPDTTWECLLSEVEFTSERRQPIAICIRRPVIGGMLGHLRGMYAVSSLNRRLITKTPFMPTGTAVTLFVTPTSHGPRIVDIQKVQPLVCQTRIL